jgi:hypothetical protein
MELKSYQQEVINDLSNYLEELNNTQNINQAFTNLWESKGVYFSSLEEDRYLRPYDNSIKGVPRVTVKVQLLEVKHLLLVIQLNQSLINCQLKRLKLLFGLFLPIPFCNKLIRT